MIPCAFHPDEPSITSCEKCDKPICVVCKREVEVGGGSTSQGQHVPTAIKTYCRVCAPGAERSKAIVVTIVGAIFSIISLGMTSLVFKNKTPLLFKIIPLLFVGVGVLIFFTGLKNYKRNYRKEEEVMKRLEELKSHPSKVKATPLARHTFKPSQNDSTFQDTHKQEEKPTVVFQVEKYYAGGSIDVKDSVIQRSSLDVGALEVPSAKFNDPKNREAYKDALRGALSDGIISDSEEKILQALRDHFNIGEDGAEEIYKEVEREMNKVSFKKKVSQKLFEVECPGCSVSFKVEDSGEDPLPVKCPECGIEGEL
ncbi:MAG: hypothetical protein QGH39_06495 [Candidatus Thermoplasmatota archaeon]|jgi:uncharacterized membrane protein|nr:hypothetical protein [Candidatus Thermoplasmatota archaeon]MDP7265192.1 hypothetical protein [Candidatus Thermoplasmatota archaeon]